MKFHPANWPAPKHIKALTTTVDGGVSQGVYQSLNLGLHVEDEAALVTKNRALLKQQLNLPNSPVWLNQVHGTDIVELTGQQSTSEQPLSDADGSYTRERNVVCGILTADCMPVFLTNKAGDRIAVLHAGWRGLADGIVEKGVKKLACPVDSIIAWAGPCIGSNAFEIGDEVRQQLGGADSSYFLSEKSSPEQIKWYADLYSLTKERLLNVGVTRFTHSRACTYTDKDSFFSYRRTGQCGRMASLIWMSE